MMNRRLNLKNHKTIVCVIHLLFLALMFAGVGTMYLNDNLGVGITRIHSSVYEDTDEFTQYFNDDLADIFQYMEYNEIFATGGSIDISKTMLEMTFGPNDTRSYSLNDIIKYLQSLGYSLNGDFECIPVSVDENRKPAMGYVAWSASEPDIYYTSLKDGMRHCSLEEISLEIINTLNRYYSTYKRLIESPSNLHFRIEYIDSESEPKRITSFSNDSTLTLEQAKTYGRYACLQGNSVFYDTNFRFIDLDTVSALSAGNPYDTKTYYLLAALDTSYPVSDPYADNYNHYVRMQNYYFLGFALMVVGGLTAAASLLYLLSVSGKQEYGDSRITLSPFDQTSTETGLILLILLAGASLLAGRYTLVRIAHLTLPEESWDVGEKVIYTAIVYLVCLIGLFSLLRRCKAGILWKNSLIRKLGDRLSVFFTGQTFAGQLSAAFIAYQIANTVLLVTASYLYLKWHILTLTLKIIIGMLLLLWLCVNLWIFYLMFRRAADRDRLDLAIRHLAGGETTYQVDISQFSGKIRETAENLNNVSQGLEAALSEKVKSERLKADLITNVSHDIKTPLTSIINYVDLIKRENIQDEKIQRYLEVLEQKSHRLKNLTGDLVEASKASSGNLKLDISRLDFIELIYQTNGEFEEKFISRRLDLITSAPERSVFIEADGRRLWRVLENLYNNAFKYALEGSRIYADVSVENSMAVFTIKNISASPLNIKAEELTERFVRGDVARTTEGSGLGLSIARSLTQLQGGSFEIYIDGDLFKVRVAFPVAEVPPKVLPKTAEAKTEDDEGRAESEGQTP